MKKTLYMVLAAFLAACHFEPQSSLPIAEYTAPGSAWQKDLESKEAVALELLENNLETYSDLSIPVPVIDDDSACYRLMPVFALDSVQCRSFSDEDGLLSMLTPVSDHLIFVHTAQNITAFIRYYMEDFAVTPHNYQRVRGGGGSIGIRPAVAERVRHAVTAGLPMVAVCVYPGLDFKAYFYSFCQKGHWMELRSGKPLTYTLKDYVESLPITTGGMLQ